MPRQREGEHRRWREAGGRRGAASGKGGETGGDGRRRDERDGDHPLQKRSIQNVVAIGGVEGDVGGGG